MSRKHIIISAIIFAMILAVTTFVLFRVSGDESKIPVVAIVALAGVILTHGLLRNLGKSDPTGKFTWFGKQTGISAPAFALLYFGAPFGVGLLTLLAYWLAYGAGIAMPEWARQLTVAVFLFGGIICFVLIRSRFKVRD